MTVFHSGNSGVLLSDRNTLEKFSWTGNTSERPEWITHTKLARLLHLTAIRLSRNLILQCQIQHLQSQYISTPVLCAMISAALCAIKTGANNSTNAHLKFVTMKFRFLQTTLFPPWLAMETPDSCGVFRVISGSRIIPVLISDTYAELYHQAGQSGTGFHE
jgi:hypothetical protein